MRQNNKKLTFKGGVHPNDAKHYNKDKSIERLPYPEKLIIALSQGTGKPSVLTKEVGDKVRRGEVIATPSGAIGNIIVSPADGTIAEVISITLPQSIESPAVVIKTDNPGMIPGDDDFVKIDQNQTPLEMIKSAGIVGMGGAGFPTHIKYSIPDDKKCEFFIVNASECEPCLCSDYRLLIEKADECIKGVIECAKILRVRSVFLALEDNKSDALDKVDKALNNNRELMTQNNIQIDVKVLKTKYPQGDEKNLVKVLTKREVPSGKLPLDAGVIISNLGTCYAVYEAIYKLKPLMERVVSVTGDAIKTPKNVLSPLGATAEDLIRFSDGFIEDPEKMISGGPMMGFSFFNTNTPVVKTTSGLTFLKKAYNAKSTPCISCGRCVNACPMHLLPTRLFKLIKAGKYQEAMDENLMDCRECGCCEFICPSNIDLVQGFKFGKKMGRMSK